MVVAMHLCIIQLYYGLLCKFSLTVEEHIWLFSQLRKRDGEDVVLDVDQLLKDIGLTDKRTCKSVDLSGGMKRKLCVALAFVGGSSTVILDEPTAGVDPYSRRAIWELLLKFKPGRTIILSTHHMDEADVLGDRIAIICNGKLRAVGSSLFLKDRFGSGYYLTLQKKGNSMARESSTSLFCSDTEETSKTSEESNCKITAARDSSLSSDPVQCANLLDFVQGYINSAVLVEDSNLQTRFRIPDDTDHGNELVQLLDALEESKDDLGIANYGISDTGLEEVFLKIASPNNIEVANASEDFINSSIMSLTDSVSLNSGTSVSNLSINIGSSGFNNFQKARLLFQQFCALFGKRFHNFKRSIRAFATQILAPAVFVCLSTIVTQIIPVSKEMPPLELQPWHLEINNQPLVTFYSNDNRGNQISNKLENSLFYYPHYGTRCLDEDVYSIRNKPCHSSKKYEADAMFGELKDHLDCKDDKHKCTVKHTDKTLPKGRLRTNDYLYDLSGQNNTHWLLSTESRYRMSRYGGFTFAAMNDLGLVDQKDISSALNLLLTTLDIVNALPPDEDKFEVKLESLLDFAYSGENIKVWVNNHGVHAGTSFVNGINNLLLRTLLPENKTAEEYGIVTTSHPLRRTENSAIQNAHGGFLASAICILFAFSFLPAGFVVFVVEEKSSNSKDLQILCGIKPFLYWLVNWMWDMVNYIVTVVLCILILLAFDRKEFISEESLPFFVTLLLLYGWSVTPLMYIMSRFFKEPSSCFVILAGLNVFLGTLSTLGSYIPPLISLKMAGGELKFDETLNKALSFVPHYCLTKGVLDMCLLQAESELKSSFGVSVDRNLMDLDKNGLGIVLMAVMGLVLNIIVLVLEEPWCLSLMRKLRLRLGKNIASKAEVVEEDVDVKGENQRVLSGEASNDMLRLEELTKVHFGSPQPAVNRLSVGVPQAQCFGLLGVNGAGKSTTFKMLTGNLSVTSGDAFVAGYSVCSNMGQVRQLIGYCPQSDALNPLLTGREHLEFYAKARGTEPANVKLVAIWAIKTFGLTAYADKKVQSYSGGNRRKLSIAIALIGGPPVIFLDEPTAGMDPVARRFLWNCINKVVKSGKTVILTSHSMEECEALCNRLAIMVNGSFQCLGSLQHLKHRFGGGYTIILRVGGMNPDLRNIQDYISFSLPSAKLVDHRYNMLQYQLGKNSIPLSKLFKTMESAKVSYGVEDYSVSQTTLEQVFMNFAKNQRKSKKAQATVDSLAEGEEGIPLQDLENKVITVTIPEDSEKIVADTPFFRSLSSAQSDDDGIASLEVFEGTQEKDTTNIIISERL
ncbi:ATP-binding cassette sub-family A member 1 [Elysia marginata]|uniref:ATP-binding cassette sub-family A member 1 n=1 Tax=Elysia marginata TaxID=1093978 RepID=A0AAV4EE72_9GAST|nr:ATP-binding cassette sub-family A member 1 [Elysia marginata]